MVIHVRVRVWVWVGVGVGVCGLVFVSSSRVRSSCSRWNPPSAEQEGEGERERERERKEMEREEDRRRKNVVVVVDRRSVGRSVGVCVVAPVELSWLMFVYNLVVGREARAVHGPVRAEDILYAPCDIWAEDRDRGGAATGRGGGGVDLCHGHVR